jgi:hypothetical protein
MARVLGTRPEIAEIAMLRMSSSECYGAVIAYRTITMPEPPEPAAE